MEATITQAIKKALEELGIAEVDFVVEHPNELSYGDYASNAALAVTKVAGKPPQEIAEELQAALEGQLPDVERIEVAGPGFLNFRLKREFFSRQLNDAREAGEAWGRNGSHSGEFVLIEYTSPNLFKPLHVGNLVGNIVGESLARLFDMNGAEVRRLNYPSDIGLTVAKAVWGLRQSGGDADDIAALGEAYRIGNDAYETDETAKTAINEVNEALYAESDPELAALRERGIATSKRQLAAIMERLGTQFDAEVPESQAGPTGQALVREHTGDVFEESEGAIVYRGEKAALHTRVFINSKGLPTYEAKDLGNFARKHELYPEWTRSIIVTGNEQTDYFKVIFAAIREVFAEAQERVLEHVPTGFLTLTTGKMSSRKGNVLTGESLLYEMEAAARERAAQTRTADVDTMTAQVAVAALKYQILRHGVGSDIVFDKEQALSFEGDSGPYLQYTHARICSVLEKAAAEGIDLSLAQAPAEPYEIEKLLYRFPEVVQEALAERAPQKVTTFLTEIAGEFNTFYAKEPIADPSDEYAPYKAALADAVRQTLHNGLWVLGIKAPERM